MLGFTNPPEWTMIHPNRRHSFQLRNCTFYGTDGVALEYSGTGVLLQNNLFEYNDWSASNAIERNGGFGTVISDGVDDLFIRNTLRFNGASCGYRSSGRRPVLKLNHIHHQCWGVIQHDGASIQLLKDAQTQGVMESNWVHSSPKYGLRFDAGKPPAVGHNGNMKENVAWKCNGIMVKGESHTVLNNLAFDKRNDKSGDARADGCTLCVRKRFVKEAIDMNKESVVMRNAADVANGDTIDEITYSLPGRLVEFNIEGDVRNELVDADNLDFRPRDGSRYNTHSVGPYRYNTSIKHYWIPGRQLYKASTPVPPDGGTTVKVKSTYFVFFFSRGMCCGIYYIYFL